MLCFEFFSLSFSIFLRLDVSSYVLCLNLFQHYSNPSIAHPSTEQLAIGLYFACQYSEDNGWYRVQIESFKKNDLVIVRYIDYGNTEVVSMSRLRPLDKDFLIEPWMVLYLLFCKVILFYKLE